MMFYSWLLSVLCRYICCRLVIVLCFFKQKTAYEMLISDWSSDVCSSDLLNSAIGLLRSEALPPAIDTLLARAQNDLFDLGAELCIPGHVALKNEHVLFLEEALALHNAELGKLEEFIRSEEHTSELQSLMRISYAVFCLKKNKNPIQQTTNIIIINYIN